jgi:hypothetical protein
MASVSFLCSQGLVFGENENWLLHLEIGLFSTVMAGQISSLKVFQARRQIKPMIKKM